MRNKLILLVVGVIIVAGFAFIAKKATGCPCLETCSVDESWQVIRTCNDSPGPGDLCPDIVGCRGTHIEERQRLLFTQCCDGKECNVVYGPTPIYTIKSYNCYPDSDCVCRHTDIVVGDFKILPTTAGCE